MNRHTVRGLRYPYPYVIKYFFKVGLDQKPGSVLELGCGNGCNLQLFRDFDWRCVGVDYDLQAIDDALANFLHDDPSRIDFYEWDLNAGMLPLAESFDVLLIPNFVYYLGREVLGSLLTECRGLLSEEASFMLSCRSTGDWRYGRGLQISDKAFIIDTDLTGEIGAHMAFYEPEEMVSLIEGSLGRISNLVVLRHDYENLQRGEVINNHDFVVWGSLA